MAATDTDLFRSLIGDKFKNTKVKTGVYPGDNVLDPQFIDETYYSKKLGRNVTRQADVTVHVGGKDGPEVDTDGGTSLHDVSGWFPSKEFWIPEGTEYTDEIFIRKDDKKKSNPASTVTGYHYQLEARTRMAVVAFQGALNNMTRAAIARQVQLAKRRV